MLRHRIIHAQHSSTLVNFKNKESRLLVAFTYTVVPDSIMASTIPDESTSGCGPYSQHLNHYSRSVPWSVPDLPLTLEIFEKFRDSIQDFAATLLPLCTRATLPW